VDACDPDRIEANSKVGKNTNLSERQKQINNAQGGIIAVCWKGARAPGTHTGEGLPRLYPCPCLNEK
jgi:hypothetical protein